MRIIKEIRFAINYITKDVLDMIKYILTTEININFNIYEAIPRNNRKESKKI